MNEETKILGAQIIVDEIMQRGVAQLFTYPGGTIAPIFDCAIKSGLPIITSRHEQGAGYAALAVARIERKAQVVAVTSGPGVTNIVTPVADAFFDSTPLVVLCGQVGTGDLGDTSGKRQKGFQEVNTIELLKPVSKVCLRVMRTEDLAQVMTVAFDIANSGRPGPVVIDLPMDVQRNAIEKNSCSVKDKNSASEVVELDNISLAVDWMSESKRPLIIAGQGVLQAGVHTKLRELVDKTGIPVSHSLLGIGAIPAWWDQNLGYHGHTGSQAAGKAIHEADLLLVLGSRLDVRQTGTMVKDFSPQARVIRVEIDEPEIQASRINVDLTIKSDLRTVMQLIVEKIGVSTLPDWSPWLSRIRELITSYSPAYQENRALKPQEIIEKIAYLTREQNVIVSTGVGAHQHWVARHFNFSYPDRLFLTSGGHGAMGYDLPSAIGAKIARRNAMVLCIVGDGSFQMNIQELAMLKEYDLPIKIVVLDNNRLGLVSHFQKLNWDSDPTCGDKWNPEFSRLAEVYGLRGFKIESRGDLDSVLDEFLQSREAALVHCIIDSKEDISPMLLAGQSINDMWHQSID